MIIFWIKSKLLHSKTIVCDLNLILRLRRGRMIRLRQCLSYIKLLTTALDDYDEKLFEDDKSIASLIYKYDELENARQDTGAC